LLNARLIDAVIALPLNVFYGAGVPACLLILRRDRPKERRDKILLIYAARHYRELAAQNELRPQDEMRILVHYHAYGDATKVHQIVKERIGLIEHQIDLREEDEVGVLIAEFAEYSERRSRLESDMLLAITEQEVAITAIARKKAMARIGRLEKQMALCLRKLSERDERIDEARRRANDDRASVAKVGDELADLYQNPTELMKHARVVDMEEVIDNEYNLNVPRFVNTFEPKTHVDVSDALSDFQQARVAMEGADQALIDMLRRIGYGAE
jgi:type I restriction enzyme M protein